MIRGAAIGVPVGMLRYINRGIGAGARIAARHPFKCFILLQFGAPGASRARRLVQRTKIRLTGPNPLPRMNLLRRTSAPRANADISRLLLLYRKIKVRTPGNRLGFFLAGPARRKRR